MCCSRPIVIKRMKHTSTTFTSPSQRCSLKATARFASPAMMATHCAICCQQSVLLASCCVFLVSCLAATSNVLFTFSMDAINHRPRSLGAPSGGRPRERPQHCMYHLRVLPGIIRSVLHDPQQQLQLARKALTEAGMQVCGPHQLMQLEHTVPLAGDDTAHAQCHPQTHQKS